MAKNAYLSDDYREFEDFLAELPEEVAEKEPSFYALKLVAQNGRNGTEKSFQNIADKVNNDLDLLGDRYVSAIKLGKLLKNPLPTIERIMNARSDRQSSTVEAKSSLAQKSNREGQSLNYRNPALSKALLQVMEFTAHVTGDRSTEKTLAAMNKDLAGDKGYKNPLIATLEAPQRVKGAVEQSWQEGKAREDRAVQLAGQAVNAVRETAASTALTAWNRVVEDTATVQKGLGRLFSGAADIGKAVAARAKQDIDMVQSALYVRETMGNVSKSAESAEEQRLRVASLLKDAMSRT